MPHLRFKGLEPEVVRTLSKELPTELAQLLETTTDNFSFECVNSTFFENGEVSKFYPFVELAWFDRGQEIQDKCARLLTQAIQARVKSDYVAVVFIDLAKSAYYENAEHFAK